MKRQYLRLNNFEKDFKEDTEREKYTFEGYLAKYGNVDRHGDIIAKGAFKESIENKNVYTLRYNHMTASSFFDEDTEKALDSIIGTFKAEDREDGVYIYGEIFPEYKKVYDLLKSGALSEMSIGFMVEDKSFIEKIKDTGFKFLKATIREGSIVDVPANPEAIITAVKNYESSFDEEIEEIEVVEDSEVKKSNEDQVNELLGRINKIIGGSE